MGTTRSENDVRASNCDEGELRTGAKRTGVERDRSCRLVSSIPLCSHATDALRLPTRSAHSNPLAQYYIVTKNVVKLKYRCEEARIIYGACSSYTFPSADHHFGQTLGRMKVIPINNFNVELSAPLMPLFRDSSPEGSRPWSRKFVNITLDVWREGSAPIQQAYRTQSLLSPPHLQHKMESPWRGPVLYLQSVKAETGYLVSISSYAPAAMICSASWMISR